MALRTETSHLERPRADDFPPLHVNIYTVGKGGEQCATKNDSRDCCLDIWIGIWLLHSEWFWIIYTATVHLNHCYIFDPDSKCPKMFPPNILRLCLFVTFLSLGLGNQVCEKWNLNKNDPICRFLFKWSVCTYR